LLTNKEAAMKRLLISGFLALLYVTNSVAQDTPKSDRKGGDSKVKQEAVVSGYLTDLNGKYKLRVSESTYNPGGSVAAHHHAAPGLRVITAGEWSQTSQDGKTMVYKAGDAFYEAGNVTHSSVNKGKAPVVILSFEIIPVDWKGPTLIAPKSK
jgi:quercetin dioxygenase-like cupin family protein